MASRPAAAGAGLVVAGVLASVAAGALTATAYLSEAAPADLRPTDRATAFPVTQTDVDDARTVTVDVGLGSATPLEAPGPGRVTASTCGPGASFVSGETSISLDGAPVVSLSTSQPLWRDLQEGDEGSDVKALQAELVRLGRVVAVDGHLGSRTARAVRDLLTSVGVSPPPAPVVLPLDQVLWLPGPSSELDQCDAVVGSTLQPGDHVATVRPAVVSATVHEVPDDLVPGERELTIDGVVVRVEPSTWSVVEDDLREIAGLGSVRPADQDDARPVVGRLSLVNPVQAAVVPPSAVTGLDDGAGCVLGQDGRAHAVTVVGSELGRTSVLFAGPAPPAVRIEPGPGASCG